MTQCKSLQAKLSSYVERAEIATGRSSNTKNVLRSSDSDFDCLLLRLSLLTLGWTLRVCQVHRLDDELQRPVEVRNAVCPGVVDQLLLLHTQARSSRMKTASANGSRTQRIETDTGSAAKLFSRTLPVLQSFFQRPCQYCKNLQNCF